MSDGQRRKRVGNQAGENIDSDRTTRSVSASESLSANRLITDEQAVMNIHFSTFQSGDCATGRFTTNACRGNTSHGDVFMKRAMRNIQRCVGRSKRRKVHREYGTATSD